MVELLDEEADSEREITPEEKQRKQNILKRLAQGIADLARGQARFFDFIIQE